MCSVQKTKSWRLCAELIVFVLRKVADYPFTTLVPNLGVCEMDYRTTVFADIPGDCFCQMVGMQLIDSLVLR